MFVRHLAIAAAAVALSLAAAESASAYSAETTDNINVRSGPGTGYGVVFTLPAGAPVEVGNCEPSWCWVDSGGGSGWVSAEFLSDGGGYYQPAPVYRPYRPYRPYYSPPSLFFGFGYHRGPYWR